MIGLDTSAIIDIFRGNKEIGKFLDINKEPLAVTIISYMELFFGLDMQNPKHVSEGNYYRELFNSLYNVTLNAQSCEQASRILWKLRKEGKEVGQFDCIIAGSFCANGVNKILTKNSKDFEKIKELKVISY